MDNVSTNPASVAFVIVLTAALANPTLAHAQIYIVDIVSGDLIAEHNPTLSIGGNFTDRRGRFLGFVENVANRQIYFRRSATNGIAIVAAASGATNNVASDVDLAGGDFDGMDIKTIPTDAFIGWRDDTSSNLALLGPSGINTYNFLGFGDPPGSFASLRNPVLSGGDFGGMTFSQIASGAYIGYRDGVGSQIAIVGPNGIHSYDIVSGALAGQWDPAISGGTLFDGLRFSELSPDDFVGYRDQALTQIALVPEPGPLVGSLAVWGALALFPGSRTRLPTNHRTDRPTEV